MKAILTPLLALAWAAPKLTVVTAATEIVDLSQHSFDISDVFNNNVGAAQLQAIAPAFPELRTVTVLEQGQVVAEYVRPGVDKSIPQQAWSTTKSWMSLIIGLMVQDGDLTIDETLGGIFNDPALWSGMPNAAWRQAVTVEELLTMTSGLVRIPAGEDAGPGGDLGGGSLYDAIATPFVTGQKIFTYMDANNIMSYIVQKKTNLSPREYMVAKVFPYLGIVDDELNWYYNADGLEYGYTGLLMTPTQMAKLGQLYLQGGKSSPNHQLINEEWVSASTSEQTTGQIFQFDITYGYLWWVELGDFLGQPDLFGSFACALGLGGQNICYSPKNNRVVVEQRDLTDPPTAPGLSPVTVLSMNPTVVFDPNNVPGSGQGMGDPHFQDFGGNWYDFHGQCDLVYLANPRFASDAGLSVHIRTSPRYEYSYIESVAIQIDHDILEVGSWGDYFWNGVQGMDLPRMMADAYLVNHTVASDKMHRFTVDLLHGQEVVVTTHKDMVAVKMLGLRHNEFKESVGLLGKFGSGEHLGRNGTVVEDVNKFGQEWQRLGSEPMLFQVHRSPQHPTPCVMPGSSKSESRRRLGQSSIAEETAAAACAHWRDMKAQCIFDVMATGDLELAEAPPGAL